MNRGAELTWLSQYPHECEILFAPLTGIEMLGTRVEGAAVVAEMRLNVNLLAPTIEQIVNRRHHLLGDMASNMSLELRAALVSDGVGLESESVEALRREVQMTVLSDKAESFNDDAHFEKAVRSIMKAKHDALAPLTRFQMIERQMGASCLEEHAETMISLLRSTMGDVRRAVAAVLHRMSPAPAFMQHTEELLTVLKTAPSAGSCKAAALVLSAQSSFTPELIKQLVGLLVHRVDRVSDAALAALSRLEPLALVPQADALLTQLAAATSDQSRFATAHTLACIARAAGVSAAQLKAAHYPPRLLASTGLPAPALEAAGLTPTFDCWVHRGASD